MDEVWDQFIQTDMDFGLMPEQVEKVVALLGEGV